MLSMDAVIAVANQSGMRVVQNQRGEFVLVPLQPAPVLVSQPPQRILQPTRTTTESVEATSEASESGVSESTQHTITASPQEGRAMIYTVERRVQVRSGVSPQSAKLCVLEPGHIVHVIKTKKIKNNKTNVITTKALVLVDGTQGWVSVNRHAKKTEENFIFRGTLTQNQRKALEMHDIWKQCDVTVQKVQNTNKNTFLVQVIAQKWEEIELMRSLLQNPFRVSAYKKAVLINKRTPVLVNLRRVFGSTPMVHVYHIDCDCENYHLKFREDFDWDFEFSGSRKDFNSQVKSGLKKKNFAVSKVEWSTSRIENPEKTHFRVEMQDYCTIEFKQHRHLQHFMKNYQQYNYFKGADVVIDPEYANLTKISAGCVNTLC